MTESSKNQNSLDNALLKIAQLKHENFILLEQLKSKDNILKIIFAETDIIFGSIGPDKTIEYIVGKGLYPLNINEVDVLGRHINDVIHSLPELISFLEQALQGKSMVEQITFAQSKSYQCSAHPIYDEEGKLLHLFVIAFPVELNQ